MASIFLCFCVLVSTNLSTLVNGSPIFHQQGNKLVGVPEGASRYQGVFVDTSTDGSDAVISARDSVFIFSRSGATWQQTKQLSYTIFNSGI